MKIVVCNNINSKTTLLQYTADREKPSSVKSYSIASDKADEFVKKYNNQAQSLARFTGIATITGAFAGWLSSLGKPKFISHISRTLIGGIAGFALSSIISYEFNNKLMDKYQVSEYKVK